MSFDGSDMPKKRHIADDVEGGAASNRDSTAKPSEDQIAKVRLSEPTSGDLDAWFKRVELGLEPRHPLEGQYIRKGRYDVEVTLDTFQLLTFTAAEAYASWGWPVFPMRPNKRSFKSAKYSNDRNWGATTLWSEVMCDWAEWPYAMIGVATGREAGIIIIDIDTNEGHDVDGIANFKKLLEENGPLPETPIAVSPSGSIHIYFKYPKGREIKNSAGKIAGGVDVRGNGGCIVVPPSRHPTKGWYRWEKHPEHTPMAECPDWLLELITAKDKKVGPLPRPQSRSRSTSLSEGKAPVASDAELSPYCIAALQGEVARVLEAEEGRRNDTLNKAAYSLGQLVECHGMSQAAIIDALAAAAQEIGLDDAEIAGTIDSALRASALNPRCRSEYIEYSDDGVPVFPANCPMTPVKEEGPQPLVREAPPGLPYPVGHLGPLRGVVEEIMAVSQAPAPLAAGSALAVASLCVQAHANVQLLSPTSTAALTLFMLTIAESGERKTATFKPLMTGIQDHEEEAARRRQADLRAFDVQHASWKGRFGKLQKELERAEPADVPKLEAEIELLGPEPTAPPLTDRCVTDPTIEGLIDLLADGQPSIGLMSDEAGQFLGGFGMSAENSQKTQAVLNKLWDGDPIKKTRVRGNGGHITLRGKRLAAHLMVQPGVFGTFAADGTATDIGFLPRTLICQPESHIGTRIYQDPPNDLVALVAFQARVKDVLATKMPLHPGTRDLAPRDLPLSPEAKAMLIEFYNHTETEQGPGGTFADIRGFASKAAEQAARIAGVMTLWEDLDAEEVPGSAMANAVELVRYYLSEALRLCGEPEVTLELSRAVKLRDWLRDEWSYSDIAQPEVLKRGPKCVRDVKTAARTLDILCEYGWLERLEPGTVIRGEKRKRAWRIVLA